MANQRIDIDVGLKVDKTGLNELRSSLQAVQQEAAQAAGSGKMTQELKNSAQAAQKLEKILNSAWNSKLQQFNLNKVNQEIKTTYGSVNKLKTVLESGGVSGANAYNKMASSLLTTNTQLRQSSKLLDNMATTMANTVKWGITSSIFNSITQSVQKAWSYTKNLDSSLNNIRIVTGQSAEQMELFAKNANKAAKELGKSTLDYTNASLIYYQQGLDDEDVAARAETTLKAANVTGQTGQEVSEQLTAVWNGYKVSAEEAELYVDKLAAVAATTASNLEELSTGMSKVASAANLMGVDADQLNAQLSTIIAVTRQAPESVGTALKTIYARMGDIEAGLDTETTLGNYTEEMKEMGINVLDTNGKLRDMGSVIEEIGGKWSSMTREQQLSLAQTAAGTRQYNNLLALFDNWDQYTKALETSRNAAGTLQEQQDIYMESTRAHLQQLKTETQRTYDLLFDTESINPMIDGITKVTTAFNNFIEGLGGGGKAIALFGSIAANVFNKQIADGLLRMRNNLQVLYAEKRDAELKSQLIAAGVAQQNKLNGSGIQDGSFAYSQQLTAATKLFNVQKGLTQEQYNQGNQLVREIGLISEEIAKKEQSKILTEDHKNKLKELELTQHSSTRAIQNTIAVQKEELANVQTGKANLMDTISLIERINQGENTRSNVQKMILNNEKLIKSSLGEVGLSSKQIEQEWSIIEAKIKSNNLSVQDFKRYLDMAGIEEEEINLKLAACQTLLNQNNAELDETIAKDKAILNLKHQQVDALQRQGKTQLNTQNWVKGGMAAVGVISSLSGAMSVLGDKTANTEQKVHAAGSAFSGVAMAIGSAFGPAGMVIGGVIGALGSLVSQLDFVEDAFKSTEEKMQELQESQSKIISQTNEFNNSKKALQDIAEEYETLSEKAGDYDNNLKNLTDEEKERYNELKNTILEYNPEALLAYDAEGNAILKKNELIQETIDLLREEYELETLPARKEAHEEKGKLLEEAYDESQSNLKGAQARVDYLDSDAGRKEYENIDKLNYTNAINNLNTSVSLLVNDLTFEEDFEGAELINEKFAKLNEAIIEGTIDVDTVNNFIKEIKKSGIKNSEDLITWAEEVANALDGNSYEDAVNKANDELAKATAEAESAQKIDTAYIIEDIKLEDTNWAELEDLDLDIDLNQKLAEYVEGLDWEVGQEGDYNPLITKAQELVKSVKLAIDELGLEGFNALVEESQELDINDFSSIDAYNEALKNKINEMIGENKDLFASIAPEYKSYLFEMLFGVSGIAFDENGLVSEIDKYDKLLKDKVKQINQDFGILNTDGTKRTYEVSDKEGGTQQVESVYQELSEEDLGVLSPSQVENLDSILKLVDSNKLATEGWAKALEDAASKFDKMEDGIDKLSISEETLKELDIEEDAFKELVKEIMKTSEALEDNAEQASKVAIQNLKLNKGLKDLKDNFKDNAKILKDGKKTSKEYAEAMNATKESVENILGVEVSDDFVTEHLEEIQRLAEGDLTALEELRDASVIEFITTIDKTGFETEFEELENLINTTDLSELTVGATLDDAGMYDALQALLDSGAVTADEMNEILKRIGFTPEVEEQTIEFNANDATQNGSSYDYTYTDPLTGETRVAHITQEDFAAAESSGFITIPTINAKETVYSGGKGGGAHVGKGSGGGGGGGGGGKAKKAKQTDRKEKTADRYRKVNNQLSTISTELERLGEAQEHLFGLDLYKNLEKQLDLLEKQRDVTAEKLELTKQERAEVAKELQDYGFKFQDGDISNYEAKLESYRAEINKLIDKWNKMSGDQQSGDAGEKLQEQIDKAQEKYDKIEEKIEKWTELQFETIPGLVDEMTDMAYQQIELKIEKFNIAVELSLDLQEAFDDWYEFRKKIYGDNIKYSQSSQMALERINQIYDSNTISALTDKVSTARGELAKIRNGEASEIYTGLDENGNPLKDADGNIISSEQQAIDHIKELTGDLMDSIESVYDLVDEVMDNYISSLEEAEEAMNNYYEAIDQVNDALDHQMTMMELLYGENAYDKQNQVIQQQLDTTMKGIVESERLLNELPGKIEEQEATIADYEKQLYGNTSNKDYGHGIEGSVHINGLYEERERLEKELAELQKEEKVEIEADIVGTQEQLDETAKELDDAEESLTIKVNKEELYQQELDSLNGQIAAIERLKANEEEALAISQEMYQMNLEQQREYVEQYTELLIQQYENTIKQASKVFTESLVGTMGMEGAEYEWDNLTREEEKYLDAVNSAYELKSLENKINESINSTDSLSAQKRLNQFKEEELKKLREKDKLTQYDVDRANQLYEIELKKIALEEAQNNKSKMRLRRDASGNYSYQFVADDESIADAQQELDDAINSLYNMDKDQYKQEVEELKDLHQEYEDFRTWYSEQSVEFRAENEEWYKNQCAIYEQQMIDSAKLVEDTKVNLVESANMSMIESVASANQEITTITKDNLDTLVPLVNSAFANMAENINSNPDSFKAQSVEAMNAVFEATETLQAGIDKLSAAVGAKGDGGLYDISSNYYDEAYEGAMKYADAQQKNIDKALQEAEANKALADSLEEVLKNKQLIAGIDEVDKAESDITNSIKEELDKIEEEENKTPEPEPAPPAPAPEPSKPAATKKEDKLTSDRKKGIAAAIIYESNYGGWSVDPTRKDRLKAIFGSKGSEVQSLVNSQVNGKTSEVKKFYDKNKKNMSKYHYSAAQKYDTGGYTGEWNSNDGKWAILHEKELVLNKKDTENLLSIIQIVRDLATMSFNSEEQLPEELKKIYKAMLEKLDDLKSQLFMATNQTSNQLTADTILNGMQNIYTDFLNFSGHEFEQATSLLKDTKESLGTQIRLQNNQNLNLETLGEIQTELFSSLERVLSTDLVTKVQSYIDDFKSKMLEQTEFNTISSIEQFKNISKELSSLGSHMTQDVHINADFPNVTDSYEIQTAIQNLVNSASQHISKSTR